MLQELNETDLEERVNVVFRELKIEDSEREVILTFLAPLKQKNAATRAHYNHSLRVALIARGIAQFVHLDQKALFYAGLLHDIGKAQIAEKTLAKNKNWTSADVAEMKHHVPYGYKFLRDRFNFSAEIMLWHHRFQQHGYPEHLPAPLHGYSKGTKVMIAMYGRLLALADVYDALHRSNDKFGGDKGLTDEQIKDKMLELNPDQHQLIEQLYLVEIFVCRKTDDPEILRKQKLLYDLAYEGHDDGWRENPCRCIAIACSLEPIPNKSGCTTRNLDVSRHLKLEYFITAGINIGFIFNKVASRAYDSQSWTVRPDEIYDLALEAQLVSTLNRVGGRINQGIIELLIPIVASQYAFDYKINFSVNEVLKGAGDVLLKTTFKDVRALVKMKRLAYDLCGYFDRQVSEYSGAKNVLDYYKSDLYASVLPTKKVTSIAHNGEFVNGFPTVKLVYETIMNSKEDSLRAKMEEAYCKILLMHDKDVGRGFLADCIAVGLYLCLSQHPKMQIVT